MGPDQALERDPGAEVRATAEGRPAPGACAGAGEEPGNWYEPNAESPYLSFCLFTEDKFVVIGGQHISRAVKETYDEYKRNRFREEDIPSALTVVEAEVLDYETPIQLVQLAAGNHQKLQSERREMNTENMCRMLSQTMSRRKYDVGASGVSWSEAELFLALETMGIVSESKMPNTKKATKKSMREQMVCCHPR